MILNKICFIKQIVFKKTQYIQIIHSTLSCDQGLEKQFQDNGQPQFKNSPIFQHFSQKTTKKKKTAWPLHVALYCNYTGFGTAPQLQWAKKTSKNVNVFKQTVTLKYKYKYINPHMKLSFDL